VVTQGRGASCSGRASCWRRIHHRRDESGAAGAAVAGRGFRGPSGVVRGFRAGAGLVRTEVPPIQVR
jgi:hypothetical protein